MAQVEDVLIDIFFSFLLDHLKMSTLNAYTSCDPLDAQL